ncbi:acid protease [Echria macrotheca]|uniref:Acid protease n=1 Tax=Echria macrotheca TaxID=438768 RepID=A0AAJ0B2B4_9PEZI|nr:acid protease [Echria macrotheca]
MSSLAFLAAAAGLLTGASGAAVDGFPGATAGPGYLHVPLSPPTQDALLRKRADVAGTTNLELPNFGSFGYTIDISLGTPPQPLTVAVDTGSSELWVNPDCTKSSRAKNETIDGHVYVSVDGPITDPVECKKRGRYESSKSSSVSKADVDDRTISYLDETSAALSYVKDSITIGSLKIDDQIFGVAKTSQRTGIGIMGFGPGSFGFNNSGTYPLILTTMARQKVIASPAFSMHLNHLDNKTGSVLFGGVDKKKYSGSLAKIPFITVEKKFSNGQSFQHTSYYVKVKGAKLADKTLDVGGGDGFVASLDCGSGASLFPPALNKQICTTLNGTVQAGTDRCIVDCALRQRSGGLTISLDGKDIVQTFDNLIDENVHQEVSTCSVMVSDGAESPYILGAPFIRSTYSVFDWGNGNLHIAQSADCGSNIVAIGSGPDAVPSGNGECSSSLAVGTVVNSVLMFASAVLSGLFLL